jgi:hypothetical protein
LETHRGQGSCGEEEEERVGERGRLVLGIEVRAARMAQQSALERGGRGMWQRECLRGWDLVKWFARWLELV